MRHLPPIGLRIVNFLVECINLYLVAHANQASPQGGGGRWWVPSWGGGGFLVFDGFGSVGTGFSANCPVGR